jgi:Ca2+-dependent lipid-binding protein
MQPLFPPPEFQKTRDEITDVYRKALSAGIGVVGGSLSVVVALFQVTRNSTGISRTIFTALEVIACLGVTVAVIVGMRQYTENRIKGVWETEVWQAERQQGRKLAKTHTAESAQWLNSLLAAVWPLVNPDLFTSISDTLEVSSLLGLGLGLFAVS